MAVNTTRLEQMYDPSIWEGWMYNEPDESGFNPAYLSWSEYYWQDPPSPLEPRANIRAWYDWADSDPDSAANWANYYWGSLLPDKPWESADTPFDAGDGFIEEQVAGSVPPSVTEVPHIPSDQSVLSMSGIDWSQQPASDILPSLLETSLGLPALAEGSGDVLQAYYDTLMRNALGPEAFQGTLNQMASRNMLDSSVASEALAGTAQPIIEGIGEQAYRSLLDQINLQMQVPGMLGDIAQLGDVGIEYGDPLDATELLLQTLGYI